MHKYMETQPAVSSYQVDECGDESSSHSLVDMQTSSEDENQDISLGKPAISKISDKPQQTPTKNVRASIQALSIVPSLMHTLRNTKQVIETRKPVDSQSKNKKKRRKS